MEGLKDARHLRLRSDISVTISFDHSGDLKTKLTLDINNVDV